MKTIITYGTFDLFHIGHVNLLKRARALGDRLIVAVSTDEFNALKGKVTLIPFAQRAAILEACRYVDLVIAEESWEQKLHDIKAYGVSALVMGDDWRGKFDQLKEACKVVYLERTKDISSSAIKQAVSVLKQMNENFGG